MSDSRELNQAQAEIAQLRAERDQWIKAADVHIKAQQETGQALNVAMTGKYRAEADLATRTRERDEAREEAIAANQRTIDDGRELSLVKSELHDVQRGRDALHAVLVQLVAQWRENVDQIGPWLEGAVFEQCADELEAALVPFAHESPTLEA